MNDQRNSSSSTASQLLSLGIQPLGLDKLPDLITDMFRDPVHVRNVGKVREKWQASEE